MLLKLHTCASLSCGHASHQQKFQCASLPHSTAMTRLPTIEIFTLRPQLIIVKILKSVAIGSSGSISTLCGRDCDASLTMMYTVMECPHWVDLLQLWSFIKGLGVLTAKAMGHHVTVISSSDNTREEALDHLHADAFLLSTNEDEMKRAANSVDYILDTVLAFQPPHSYLSLLKAEGELLTIGAAPQPLQFLAGDMIQGNNRITGSFIGTVKEMQEILGFWVEKGLTCIIEVVKMDYVYMLTKLRVDGEE